MKAKVAAKPDLVQISTAYKQQAEGEKTIPRNKYVEIHEEKPDTPEKAKWPEFKTCKYITEAIVSDGIEKGELRKVCTEPTCPVHHPKKQMPKADASFKAEQEKRRREEVLANTTGIRVLQAIVSAVPVRLMKRDLLFIAEQLLTSLDEKRVEMVARNRSIRVKDGEAVAKLASAFVRKADESTIGKLVIESVILLSARSQPDGGKVDDTVKTPNQCNNKTYMRPRLSATPFSGVSGMTLLREIQAAATDPNIDPSTLLRKANILASRLKNPEFEAWVDHELNGYEDRRKVPSYVINTFYGPVGNLAQHSDKSSQSATIGLGDLAQFVKEFSAHVHELGLDERQEQRAKAQIEVTCAIGDRDDVFGGIRRNCAQRTPEAVVECLHNAGIPYTFRVGVVTNLDGSNGLITSHSDLTNERVTYAVASALATT